MTTLQPVINLTKFAAYLIRDNQPYILIGSKLAHLWNNLRIVPREAQDCATLRRNDRAGGQKYDNRKRMRRVEYINELVESFNARSLNEFNSALNKKDRLHLYAEYGTQWKETAELCIAAYIDELRKS